MCVRVWNLCCLSLNVISNATSQLLEAAFSLLHQDINEKRVTVKIHDHSQVCTCAQVRLPACV